MNECPDGQELYRVYRGGKTAEGWKAVCADSAEGAMRRFPSTATKAVLVRPSSYWQEQRRLGLYPTCRPCRRGKLGR